MTNQKHVLGIVRLSNGKTTLWQRLVFNETGIITQIFEFEPDEQTEDWKAIAAMGPDFHDGLLQVQVWNASSLMSGNDPKWSLRIMDFNEYKGEKEA